ncbi:MAG: signal peptide peptidase SppA [Geminicoccaceae bacterium]
MGRFLVRALAVFGFLALLLIVGLAGFAWWASREFAGQRIEVPNEMILVADWRNGIEEKPAGLGRFDFTSLEPEPSFPEILLALERAVTDDRVKGVYVRLGGDGFGFAQAQELIEVVARLRSAGKTTVAYADSFAEFGPGTIGYYVASGFERIYIQPLGIVGLTGISIETPFVKPLLDQWGIELEVGQREEHKTALNSFTEETLTPAHRETLNQLADQVYGQLVDGIASGRGLEPVQVIELIDRGPLMAEEAASAGLLDGIMHRDELEDLLDEELSEGTGYFSLERYVKASRREQAEDLPVIALVHAVGVIQADGGDDPLGGAGIQADRTAGAVKQAIENDSVDAIVLRVDSPGGSAVASETIGFQVRQARNAGKPVIVSMGNTAASGGYWISMDADRILASPGTITGSIGVIVGKPVTQEFWDDLGVNWERVQRGENADLWSFVDDYDERSRARVEAFLDHTYDAFVQGVARGRNMAADDVRRIAGGQVWSGRHALDRGLVDDLGGWLVALDAAKQAAGIDTDEPVSVQPFPPPRDFTDSLLKSLEEGFVGVGALIRLQRWLGLNPYPGGQTLRAPSIVFR